MSEKSRFLPRVITVLLCVAFVLIATVSIAQEGAPGAPVGLPAVVSVGGSGLDTERVKGALERELGVSLRIDPNAEQRLEVVVTGTRASVTYYARGREPVTRSVDLPRDQEQATLTIAFLAGNLTRDEAQALLDELRAREAASLPPPPPPPPPEPAPTVTAPKAEPKKKPAPKQTAPARPLEAEEPELTKSVINLSLYYPTTLLPHTERRRLNFELGLLYSEVGAIRGIGFTLGHLSVLHRVQGITYALAWNRAGRVRGIQAASIMNEGHGRLDGISHGDFINYRDGEVYGLQLAGIFNWVGLATGMQVSGLVGVARAADGAQIAGLVAHSPGQVRGGQVAGLVSNAKRVIGLQASGITSVAEDVTGVQLSSVNIGKKVRGMQIGFVNIADEIDGGALGVVSVARNGHIQALTWVSSGVSTAVNGGVKFGTGYTYSYLGGGHELAEPRSRLEAGLGAHVPIVRPLYVEAGAAYAGEWGDKTVEEDPVRQELRYDLRAGVELTRRLSIFAGGGFNSRLTGEGKDLRGQWSLGVALF